MKLNADKIQLNQIYFRTPAFRSQKEQTGTTLPIEKETNLKNLPASPINIKTPVSYVSSGEIDVLGNIKAKSYKLSNGQKVIIVPKKGPTVVKTYVNVGSMNEPDHLRGISHYIEHNLFNGTEDLKAGEFFKKVNAMGASTNASTSFSTTDYYISSQLLKDNDLEQKIKMHADMLQNPTFAPDMLEKERGPVISEISMVMDDPQNAAINRAVRNLYQIETNSPDLIAGTVQNIQNVNRDDVVKYYETHYTPDNFTTVITGEVEPDEVMKLVSKYFNTQKTKTPSERKNEPLNLTKKAVRTEETSAKATASTTVMAFAGPENKNTKDKITIEVLMAILTGSQNSKIKKALEPLHIGIDAGIEKIGNRTNDRKALLFTLSCSPEKTEEAIKTIYKEIFDVQNGSITQKELDIAKKQMKTTLNDIAENSVFLNNVIGSSLLDNDRKYLEEYPQILKDLTLDDLKKAADKYFDLNRVSIATINPPPKTEAKPMVAFCGNYVKKEIFDKSDLKTYKLDNNMEITTVPNTTDNSVFTLTFKDKSPAAVKPAVAEVLAGMLNRGSVFKSKEKFFDEAEENGINIGFTASADGITVCAKSDAKDLEKALKLAKEVILAPNFSQEEFELVKNQLSEAVKNKAPSAGINAQAELFKHLPYSANQKEFLNSLTNVTLNDVVGLYQYIMQNASSECITSAPFGKQPELLTKIATELSADIKQVKPNTTELFNTFMPIKENRIITEANERNQADIVKCYKFKTNGNVSDLAKFALLNTILGGNPNSRLFNDLREKQKLAYRVRSNVDYTGNTGVITLSIKTTTDNPAEGEGKLDNVKKSLMGFDKNILLMQKTQVTDDELESAKLYLKTKILDEAETGAGKVSLISKAKETPYGANYTNMLLEELDKVTKEDIRAAANYVFKDSAITSIVASQKTLDHFLGKK